MKHTPRPWYANVTSAEQGLIYQEKTGVNIALTYNADDAELVAAAPDLLEALEKTEQLVKNVLGVLRQNGISADLHNEIARQNLHNRTAIQQATGGTE